MGRYWPTRFARSDSTCQVFPKLLIFANKPLVLGEVFLLSKDIYKIKSMIKAKQSTGNKHKKFWATSSISGEVPKVIFFYRFSRIHIFHFRVHFRLSNFRFTERIWTPIFGKFVYNLMKEFLENLQMSSEEKFFFVIFLRFEPEQVYRLKIEVFDVKAWYRLKLEISHEVRILRGLYGQHQGSRKNCRALK